MVPCEPTLRCIRHISVCLPKCAIAVQHARQKCCIDSGLRTGRLSLLVLMASVPVCCRYLHQGRVTSWSIGALLVLDAL